MSYDLMVFEPSIPPVTREGFMQWYNEQTKWEEDHGYNNPEIPTPALRSWFQEMIKQYPPMNGPLASDDVDNSKITDYSVGRSVIYAAFAWSEAVQARSTMFNLAQKHKVGFFDVSENNGGVWLPQSDGSYVCIHGDSTNKPQWWQFWKR